VKAEAIALALVRLAQSLGARAAGRDCREQREGHPIGAKRENIHSGDSWCDRPPDAPHLQNTIPLQILQSNSLSLDFPILKAQCPRDGRMGYVARMDIDAAR
jgi:hypothetical protein